MRARVYGNYQAWPLALSLASGLLCPTALSPMS